MATRRIETQLTIRGIDRYSGMLKSMRRVTGGFSDKVRRDMGKLQAIRGPLRLIEDFRKQQSVVAKSGIELDRAKDRVKRLHQQIVAAKSPSAALRREFERARGASARLADSHHRNRQAMHRMLVEMRDARVDTSRLADEEQRLAGALRAGTAAMGPRVDRLRRLEALQARVAASRERMDKSLARAANLSFVGGAATQTGRRILSGMSAPVQQAMAFETAMSDVRKVVSFKSPTAFKDMSSDILALSTRIPMAADGLAQIVAAGGQADIPRKELLKFAEMAAKVGVAFDISADNAGESMAKVRTGLKLSLEDTGLLFDSINHLSNNMASDAPALVNFMRRAGGDGKVAGFQPRDMAAFGSAMIAAGAQADVAATSFRNMGKRLSRGEAATRGQHSAFKALGLEAVAVAKAMQDDSVGTTIDVLERIRSLPAHRQSAVMSQLFGDEARGLAMLVGNMDTLTDALDHVSDVKKFAGSADAEYAERAKTTANNLQLTRNQLTRLGVTIGEVVLPPFNEFLKNAQVVIDRMVEWTKAHPKLTKWLVTSGIALGGLATVGGAMLTVGAGLIGTLAVLRFGLVGLSARALFAAGDIAAITGRFAGLHRLKLFRLASLIAPLRWGARLVPAIPWLARAGALKWATLIKPLKWIGRAGLRFIPVIGWAVLAGELAWHLLIKPLGWDKYLPKINWRAAIGAFSWEGWLPKVDWSKLVSAISWPEWIGEIDWSRWLTVTWTNFLSPWRWRNIIGMVDWQSWFDFAWSAVVPKWDWSSIIPKLNLSGRINWHQPIPKPRSNFRQTQPVPRGPGGPVGGRAGGGAVRALMPYRVNEHTARSEIMVPSRSGGILNVPQAQAAVRSYLNQIEGGRGGLRAAGIAAATAGAVAGAPAAAGSRDFVVHGGVHVQVVAGASDPAAILDEIERGLGDRLAAAAAASFSD